MANKTIRLVEDNPDHQAPTLRALKRHNVEDGIVVAQDGAEALSWLYPDQARTYPSPQVIFDQFLGATDRPARQILAGAERGAV